uniref:IS110 family transposase n=1 Tax=Novipirellula aureliae TaxID=2527966 RepID=UPI0011B68956
MLAMAAGEDVDENDRRIRKTNPLSTEQIMDVAIVNPKQVRHFAKGIGHDAKTDPIDAKVIAKFGEVVQPEP